jgi:hypothetical protein
MNSDEHQHKFAPEQWPFNCPPNTLAYCSALVIKERHPALLVFHDHDGDWQILHGDLTDQDEISQSCLGCFYQHDPTLGELADMPLGWVASRGSVNDPWVREEYEEADDSVEFEWLDEQRACEELRAWDGSQQVPWTFLLAAPDEEVADELRAKLLSRGFADLHGEPNDDGVWGIIVFTRGTNSERELRATWKMLSDMAGRYDCDTVGIQFYSRQEFQQIFDI